uniref:Uncharacterized protein n=1 Tax=Caenorhabditis japonica TaxID=281687 RepID=A0A8R1EGP7_CAEJA
MLQDTLLIKNGDLECSNRLEWFFLVSRKHAGQVKTSRFLILSQSTGMRGCVILFEDEALSTGKQEGFLFWDVLT